MSNRSGGLLGLLVVLLVVVTGMIGVAQRPGRAEAQEDWQGRRDGILAALRASVTTELTTTFSRQTGNLTFLRAEDGQVLVEDGGAGADVSRATNFLAEYGALMGITDPAVQLAHFRTLPDSVQGTTHIHFTQHYRGVPVFGAQVAVHLNGQGITALNGLFVPDIDTEVQPAVDSAAAARIAVGAVKRAERVTVEQAATSLYIYRTGLLEGYQGENRLAYAVEVEGGSAENPVKEQVWVDAHTGQVLNRVSMVHEDLYRIVYSPTYDPDNPEANIVREEGDPPVLPVPNPVDNLYDFSGQTYNLFANGFQRDSYDGAGKVMRTVYLVNDACPNAYWDGQSTNYCPGFDLDDVVAHEWGHAYTQYTHGLIYQYQAGALNESYSDIWGETVDLFNSLDGAGGSNNSDPYPAGQRWLVGEDLSAAQYLLLRNMWDPETHPVGAEDPARVQSPNYYCGSGDQGGVHSNSGVSNHTFAMLVDGKTFNGQTVAGIGFIKATHIYYRAMDVYQIPSTGFPEHADALEASCSDLIGLPLRDFQTGQTSSEVISAGDCQQVTAAVTATEMRLPPLCDYQPILDPNTPALCSGADSFFSENWESGTDGWTLESIGTGDAWPDYNWETVTDVPEPYTSTAIFAINEVTGTCAVGGDISGHFTLTSPDIVIPAQSSNYELRFDHYVATELGYDGGNLKYSRNGAAFEIVPPEAFAFNPYNEVLEAAPPLGQNTNPLAGEDAFTGTDEGTFEGSWGTSIVDLALLGSPGDTITLQYDFGIDGCNGVTGWYVDNIDAYTCAGGGTPTPTVTGTPPSPTSTVTPGGPTLTPTATGVPPTVTASVTPGGPTLTPTATAGPTFSHGLYLPLIWRE